MKVAVKQCLAPMDRTARFEAGVGDIVLVASGNQSYVEATLRSIKSPEIVVISVLEGDCEVEREIPTTAIHGLVVGS